MTEQLTFTIAEITLALQKVTAGVYQPLNGVITTGKVAAPKKLAMDIASAIVRARMPEPDYEPGKYYLASNGKVWKFLGGPDMRWLGFGDVGISAFDRPERPLLKLVPEKWTEPEIYKSGTPLSAALMNAVPPGDDNPNIIRSDN